MEEQDSETQSSGSGGEEETLKLEPEGLRHDVEDQHVLQFLDSLDGYITLMDSLSLTLRQVKVTLLIAQFPFEDVNILCYLSPTARGKRSCR